MNNEKKEFFTNDVEVDVGGEEIVLAPNTEIIDEAKEIAQNTKSDEKFPFYLQYDVNQKEFLVSMLQTVGAVIERDDEENYVLTTKMNMTQLAFIKRLDCVERVRTNEGMNPFTKQYETSEIETNASKISTVETNLESTYVGGHITDEWVPEEYAESVAEASAAASPRCISGPTNTTRETAQVVLDESYTSGSICCPGAEQWFKFTASATAKYTICTKGSIDTVGALYEENGANPVEEEDDGPCGMINFRIIRELTAGTTYYVKVRANGNDEGSYNLRITKKTLANSVSVSPSTIVLDNTGNTYELPSVSGEFANISGAVKLNSISFNVYPTNANEKRILLYSFNPEVISTVSGWYDGNKIYNTMKVEGQGIAKLLAYDYDEYGKGAEFYVYVGGEPVTDIKFDCSKITISVGEVECIIKAIYPSNALNKNVVWQSENPNIASVSQDGLVTAHAAGTTTITATTVDGGYNATCTVNVDSRPHVKIEKTIEGGYNFFNVLFPESENGLIWKSIGMELDNADQTIFSHHWARYNYNKTQGFNEKQLAFLYLLDPLGVTYYMKNIIYHRFEQYSADEKVHQACMFKDRVYTIIFGTYPRLIKVFPDNSVSYYEYDPEDTWEFRKDFYTDAEVLFGGHRIDDWLAWADLILNYGIPFVNSLFCTIFPALGATLTAAELCRFAFFSGAMSDALSSGGSSCLDEFLQGYIHDEENNDIIGDEKPTNKQKFSKAFGWLTFALDTIVSFVASGSVFVPSMDEIITYNKVNSSVEYLVTLRNGYNVLTMQELVDYCDE